MSKHMPMRATLVWLLLLPLANCVCEFSTPDAGKSDAHATDSAGTDLATGQDTAVGVDTYVPPTDGGQHDTYVPPTDAARPDTWHPPYDANFNPDVSGIDTYGMAGIGQQCNNMPCIPGTTCLGDISDYYCRMNCTLNGTDCNPQYEHCTQWNYADGGLAPQGGCLPAGGLGAECASSNCAEIYVCVSPSGQQSFLCRARCQPGEDAGCPSADLECLPITNMDGGACLPN